MGQYFMAILNNAHSVNFDYEFSYDGLHEVEAGDVPACLFDN